MNHMTQDSMDAPWNKPDTVKEVEVTVCLSISKTFILEVPESADEEYIDKTVREGYMLPNELPEYIGRMFEHDLDLKAAGMPVAVRRALLDCSEWNVDDLEIIQE